MTFFELFDQFFQLDAQQPVPPLASKLYMYWLHEFNQARWPAQLYRRANQVYAALDVDKKSLERAVAQLEARGLLRHVAGTKLASGTWHLNYGPAAEWLAVEGNFSPQHVGNNSPQETQIGPLPGGKIPLENSNRPLLKGNFSPPIRNRQDEEKEKTTPLAGVGACVGEAAEEITLAPLPTEKKLVPPVAEPPHESATGASVRAAELPAALATEAKTLASTIGALWFITEQRNQPKWAKIHTFCRRLALLGRLPEVQQQFAGYQLQREKAGLRPHQLDTWLGSPAADFADGEWTGCDWPSVAAITTTRPGQSAQAPPARATTSVSKTQKQTWN